MHMRDEFAVLTDPGRDGVLIAPGDEGIDEPVAATSREVVVAETKAPQIVGVVGQSQVVGEVSSAECSGHVRIGGQGHGLLRQDQARRSDRLAGQRGVRGRHVVRMGASGAGARQLKHLGPEGGQHTRR